MGQGQSPIQEETQAPTPIQSLQPLLGPAQLWDGTVSSDSGVCVFIAGHQRGYWGADLESLGWNYEGFPADFGYPNGQATVPLALYCQNNVASAVLPPFPDESWGIHHGFCTFGNMHGVPFVSNSAELAYDPVEIPFVDVSSISQAIPLEDFGATPAGEHLPQCEGDLKCFQRDGTTDVPGCEGTGISNHDYCHIPSAIEPMQMWGDSTIEVSGFENTPCNGGVFHRSSRMNAPADAVPYVGQVICVFFAENLVDHWGSALSSAGWIHEGTRNGFTYSSGVVDLVDLGGTLSAMLSICQGDCDGDDDCEGDLECFERDTGGDGPTGCLGTPHSDWDYCYDPNWSEATLGVVGVEVEPPLSICQGDCRCCEGGLICFFRNDGDDLPPGCDGTPQSDWDYCYQPLPTLEDLGADPIAENMPKCTGDCDYDSQCAGDLKCFQRDGDTPVPGCNDSGAGTANHDYCYDDAEPLVLFCQHGALSARLPPFPDLSAEGGMAHGICSLYVTSTSPSMTYETMHISSDLVQMSADSDSFVEGFQNTPCHDGVFYQPSTSNGPPGAVTTVGSVREPFSVPSPYRVGGFEHTPCNGGVFLRRSNEVVSVGTEIEVSLSNGGVCVFVESSFWRSGGFLTSLEQHGFTPYVTAGFVWSISTPPSLYCTGADHVTLPATTTSHGNTPGPIALDSDLVYTPLLIAELGQTDIRMWGDQTYTSAYAKANKCNLTSYFALTQDPHQTAGSSDDERDGGFMESLVEHEGFTHFEIDGFTWREPYLPNMYCKDSDHVTLPATATSETIHGICTIGYPVAYAAASTTQGPLVYSPVDVTNSTIFTGFENTPCYGDGTFLWWTSTPEMTLQHVAIDSDISLSICQGDCNGDE
ncbi:hypothetical protein THAOC_35075 [Thalassiosira oceanica]|uniref:Uncharacterized protein n=1 Tax=Thalassiosira oceanica TaxID=159749 RepID=K0R2G4_THAOC|nr:hypothetical protein THAOC_35075 [Thalassiosira oceanica]|eukprot:EJK46265.1 hypothetical protein THAOC_35075 [Thalassiosira oceanica]